MENFFITFHTIFDRTNPFFPPFRKTVFLNLLYLFRLNILLFEKETVPLPEINVEK
jgi:hypothetical protein